MFNPFKKSYNREDRKNIDFLRLVKPFDLLSDDQLHVFVPYLYPRSYKKDEAVFFRKDPSQALYILKSGAVSLYLDIDGKMEPLVKVAEYGSFGDNCFIPESSRIYNAIVASEEAELIVLPQGNLIEILESKPRIKALVFQSLFALYSNYTSGIFEVYKSSFGFFELQQAYKKL